MHHANVNLNLIVANVTGIKSQTMITIRNEKSKKRQKKKTCGKNFIFGILLLVIEKMLNI